MPWVNLDDQMPEHPKVWRLTDAAYRLHTAGICYANRYLTDGVVPADRLRALVPKFRQSSLDELTDSAMWLPGPSNAWVIRDYLDWNRSREEVLTERERLHKLRSAAGKKGAQARWRNG